MEWQKIETAPKDGMTVIGFVIGWPPVPAVYREEGKGWNEDQPGWYAPIEDVWLNVTHWMPLPEPPKGDG